MCFLGGVCFYIKDALISAPEHGNQDLVQGTEKKQSGIQHLEFSASVELAETLDSLLPVHHGRHGGAVLQDNKNNNSVTAPHFQSLARRAVVETLTQTQGCLRACSAVILLAGLMVNIWLIRFLASGVTVSHSGDGN